MARCTRMARATFDLSAKDRMVLEQLHKAVRDSLPGMFDCRRRASKLASPEGDLQFTQDAKGTITEAQAR
jgi:hypothetical protein